MPLIERDAANAAIYESYATARRPVTTLYLWDRCPHCPPFRKLVEEVLASHPELFVQLVMFTDPNRNYVLSKTTSFPALVKNNNRAVTKFNEKPTRDTILAFLQN